MKAYKLGCRDEDYHGNQVVFAESSREARKCHSRERCDCEFIDRTCHRAPEYDKYQPGPMTIQQYLAEGWHWDCHHCGETLHEYNNPLVIAERVFCNQNHFDTFRAECEDMCRNPDADPSWFRAMEEIKEALAAADA